MNQSADLFQSFSELQAAHDDLLERQEQLGDSDENTAEFWKEVEAFLGRAQATGALFHESSDRMERRASQSILDYWTNMLHRVDRALPDLRLASFNRELAPTLPPEPCPYQGLSAFDEDRHEYFFGRDKLVDRMVEDLRDGKRLLVVLGASGSGKSSVVRAGLLRALKTGALPGSEGWRYATTVPGADAVANLARALQGPAPDTVVPEPRTGEGPIVLVIDQFEELFTLCDDRGIYREFESRLLRLVREPQPSHIVILTMRTDFEDRLPLLPRLHRRLEAARVDVGALGIQELRDAILKPAAKVGLRFAPAVVDQLVAGILGVQAGLPLLQFTLLELWRKRDKNLVTEEVYEDVGAPAKALGKSADRFLDPLIPENRRAVRRIFLQMVRIEEREETSRRVPLDEVFQRGKARDRVERMVLRLVCKARLVKLSGTTKDICSDSFAFEVGKLPALVEEEGKRGNVVQIEVAHEALVRNWATLGKWLDAERVRLATRRRHDDKAAEWVRLGSGRSGLLDEVELREVKRWLGSDEAAEVGYDPVLLALVDASQAAIERAKEEKDAIHRREREDAVRLRRRARLLAVLSVAVVILCIIASVLAALSIRNANKARRSGTSLRLAVAALENLDPDPELGMLLAYHAARVTYSVDRTVIVEAEDALHQALQIPMPELTLAHGTDAVYGVAFSPDGKRLATASTGGTAKVWDSESGEEVLTLTGHGSAVNGVAFSPDGTRIATASADRTARVWDSETGQELLLFSGHQGAVNGIAFSPDGTLLATASADGTAKVWDARTREVIHTLTGHTLFVNSVAFSPDGKRLATASADKTAKVWDAETAEEIRTLTGHTGPVLDIAFDPDGTRLATASADEMVKVWDLEGDVSLTLAGHGGVVYGLAFSVDGTRLASASADETAKVWDVASWGELSTLKGHGKPVRDVAFHPDGIHLATASTDMKAKVWHPEPAEPLVLLGHAAAINGISFHPNEARLATASADGTAKVWDLLTAQVLVTARGHTGAVNAVAFSPNDGEWLATASADGMVKVWDAVSGAELFTLRGHSDAVTDVAFRPNDGEWLATASADGMVKVWDLETEEELATLPAHAAPVVGVAFSPDGKFLMAGGAEGTWRTWEVTSDWKMGKPLIDYTGTFHDVGLSRYGERLATGTADGAVRVSDATSGQELFSLARHTDAVSDIAFNPQGTLLATASADKTAHVYVLDVEDLIELARDRATRELTPRDCKTHWPEEKDCPLPPRVAE